MENDWETLIGENLIVFFDDGHGVSRKGGVLTQVTNSHIILKNNNEINGISISRIIRFEVVNSE